MAGKKYNKALEQVANKIVSIEEAVKLVKASSFTKFDGTVNVAFKLNLDPKQADQQIRASLVLPHGTGKTKRILAIVKGDKAEEAKAAGADFVGAEDLLTKMDKENWFDFDIIVASPDMMPVLGRYGKKLGPKGLMPNPKTGTVTPNIKGVIENIKKGQIEYRLDKEANIHSVIGKVSFDDKKLVENFNALYDALKAAKPAVAKGKYVENITIAATMAPGVKVLID